MLLFNQVESCRHIMRLFSNVTTSFFILTIVFACIFSNASHANIPDLEANKDERALSNPSYVLGQHWFRKLNGSRALIEFPPAYDYLKNALSHLLPQTNLYNTKVEMTLLNSTQSNAFVIPGNHLFIYSDILEMINDEEMFYGLLAHEIAHLDLRHYERQSQHSGEELQKTLLLLGAGIAAALAGADPDTTTALWIGGIANQAENRLTYSRAQEQEADRRGRELLMNAGLSPEGMTKLFRAFFQRALGRPKLEFLSTHPSPDTRLSDSFSTEPKDTLLQSRPDTDFEFFRASVLAYRAGLEEQPLAYLDQVILHSDAKNFAKGLFSYITQSPHQALMYLADVDKPNRFTVYLQSLSYEASGQRDKALAIIRTQLELNPNNLLFSLPYAQITNALPLRGASTLDESYYLYEKRLIWRSKIHYFKANNNTAMTLNYRAQLDFSQGKDTTAQHLIKRAENNASLDEQTLIENTKRYFDLIKEVEKKQGLAP